MSVLLAIAAGALVGLALGLTGGGGSIFAVPLLIYVLGLPPDRAVPVSLVAVALTALVGGIQSVRRRLVVWQPTMMFVLGGVVGAPLGILAARHVPESALVAGFGLLALTVGCLMWRAALAFPTQASAVRARQYETDGGPVCVLAPDGQLRFSAPCAAVLVVVGLGTGILSGLFGIGGGFLIVPALVFVTRMGVHRAVATSLLIIAAIGSAGAASALWHGRLDWPVLLPFAAGGAVAMLAGRRLAERLAGPRLQKTFALLIIGVGIAMLVDSLI
ncbi:MAG: sulfite exporter TauE/SafE family protein [Gammaproteobacteria bacterium]